MDLLEELPNKPTTSQKSFSEDEFRSAISKCNNVLTPGPDKLSQRHIKRIAQNNLCFQNIINIVDAYIDLGHWPSYFKMSLFIIISKPNKTSYNSTKVFRPIVLLNMLDKLIEKVIGNRLQFQSISKYFIQSCPLVLQRKDVDRLQGQGQWTGIGQQYNYQSTTDIGLGDRHVTWKSCGISLERSGRTQGLEGSGRVQRGSQGQEMTSRDMGSSWCTHGVRMYSEVNSNDIGQQSRVEGMTSGHMQEAWWPYGKHM